MWITFSIIFAIAALFCLMVKASANAKKQEFEEFKGLDEENGNDSSPVHI